MNSDAENENQNLQTKWKVPRCRKRTSDLKNQNRNQMNLYGINENQNL